MPTNDVVLDKVLIKGGNSGFAVEMDLGIVHTVLQWFVSEAPKELRTLHNVGRAIRLNDQLIELISKEKKSSLQYIEKKMVEEGGIPDSQYGGIYRTHKDAVEDYFSGRLNEDSKQDGSFPPDLMGR